MTNSDRPGRPWHSPRLVHVALATLILSTAVLPAIAQTTTTADDLTRLRLRNRDFTPGASGRSAAVIRGLSAAREAGSTRLIVQFDGEVTAATVASLRAAGVSPLRFIPNAAVIVTLEPGGDVSRVPGVRWTGVLGAFDKISRESLAAITAATGITRHIVLFHPDVRPDLYDAVVGAAGARTIGRDGLNPEERLVEGEPRVIRALADADDVAWIYPARVSGDEPARWCPSVSSQAGVTWAEYAIGHQGWDGPGQNQAEVGYAFGPGVGLGGAEFSEVERALQEWSRYAAIRWNRINLGASRSVDVSFLPRIHSAGPYNDSFEGELAHAFFPSTIEPVAGDVHFNAQDFGWKISGPVTGTSFRVFEVALHELGHSLGLDHSADPNAVMYPYYDGRVFRTLTGDDINGIRAIYKAAPFCDFAVSPASRSIGGAGGPVTFNVDTAPGCTWTASSQAPWMRPVATTFTGPGVAEFIVDANPGTQSRVGTVQAAGIFRDVQQGPAPCSYSLFSTTAAFPTGNAAAITVTTGAQCSWQLETASDWIVIDWQATAATGPGSVAVRYLPNPSFFGRSGSVTAGGVVYHIGQSPSPDGDGDGLPDVWETLVALNPAVNDAAADPDADGVNNAGEYAAGSHPRGLDKQYLAEGATGTFFDTRFSVFNPLATDAHVLLKFLPRSGPAVTYPLVVKPNDTQSITANTLPGLAAAEFSTAIESDQAVAVDRIMSWDKSGYGSHGERGIKAPATTWYLAEGATHSGFELFYLIQNPHPRPVTLEVRYLRPAPSAPLTKTYHLPPSSRFNIWVDREDELESTDVSAVLTAGEPVIVERAMYLDRPGISFAAGHESAGITTLAPKWFLAEGATGDLFDLFVLVANPNPLPTEVRATFLLPGGATVTRFYPVGANSRFNIWVDLEDPRLRNTAVSTTIDSLDGQPIAVERSMWWPGPTPATWAEAHNSPGTIETGVKWAVPTLRSGGSRRAVSYVLIANPSDLVATILVNEIYPARPGSLPIQQPARTITIAPRTRFTMEVAQPNQAGVEWPHSMIVQSVGTAAPGIVVEYAIYTDAAGQHWAAGTNALAVKLQ